MGHRRDRTVELHLRQQCSGIHLDDVDAACSGKLGKASPRCRYVLRFFCQPVQRKVGFDQPQTVDGQSCLTLIVRGARPQYREHGFRSQRRQAAREIDGILPDAAYGIGGHEGFHDTASILACRGSGLRVLCSHSARRATPCFHPRGRARPSSRRAARVSATNHR